MLTTIILTISDNPPRELLAFLQSIPGMELTCLPLSAPAGALPLCLPPADLMILDVSTHDFSAWSMLKNTRARLGTARCLALVSSPRQIERALACGAERALLAGFSTIEFFEALQDMGLIKDRKTD